MTNHPGTEHQTVQATAVTPEENVRTIALNRVSWGAVLAGVVVALVVQILLNMLGLGVGVATLDPGTADSPSASTFSIAAGIWYVLAGIIASYAGGYIAGRLSGGPLGSTTALHGLTSWAVATLVLFYLLTTTLGSLIGGAFSGVSSVVGGLGSSAGSVAQAAAPELAKKASDPFGTIEQQVRQASGGNDPAALRDAAVSAIKAALTDDQSQSQEARERAAQALAKAQNIPVDQARKQVAQYEQQYRRAADEAKQKAVQAGQATAKVVSRGAIFGFIALVLGAIAAWFGGWSGTVIPTITRAGFSADRRRP